MALFSEADLEFTPEEVRRARRVSPRLLHRSCLFSGSAPWKVVSACIVRVKVVCTPLQMEFFGEDEVVTVIPNFKLPTTDSSLICIGVRQLLWPDGY